MDKECKIGFTERGLEIQGPCTEGLSETFSEIFGISKTENVEISGYACVNTKNGGVDKVVIGHKGTPTSTFFPYGRVCPINQRQITWHTHPTSGIAKFSEADAKVIANRVNEGIDDVSCVVGEAENLCLARALLRKNSES